MHREPSLLLLPCSPVLAPPPNLAPPSDLALPAASLPAAGEGGCLGRLASLHLEDLRLTERIPDALWLQLAPALTALTWRDIRRPDDFAVAAALAAAAQAEEELPGAPRLFRASRRWGAARLAGAVGRAGQMWHTAYASFGLLRRQPGPPSFLTCPLPLQAVRLPGELSALQGLSSLRLEFAQLDAVPAALQVGRRKAAAECAALLALHAPAWARRGCAPPPTAAGVLPPPMRVRVQALSQLTRLSLQGNRIATLPPGRYLTSLRRLTLSNNAFAELPEGLAACSR